jgi:hypothetical protein
MCPDCNKDLVDELPPLEEKPREPSYTEDWIPLAQFATQVHGALVEGAFKDRGIPVVLLSGTGHFGQIGTMGTTFQPIEGAYIVLVPREHVEEAEELGQAILGETWQSSRLWKQGDTP